MSGDVVSAQGSESDLNFAPAFSMASVMSSRSLEDLPIDRELVQTRSVRGLLALNRYGEAESTLDSRTLLVRQRTVGLTA